MSRPIIGTEVFRAIADPTRRAMLDMLRQGDRRPADLVAPFRMSKPAISQHLRVLRMAGLVSQRRVGRSRLYSLNARHLKAVSDWISHYEKFWRRKFVALGKHLDSDSAQ